MVVLPLYIHRVRVSKLLCYFLDSGADLGRLPLASSDKDQGPRVKLQGEMQGHKEGRLADLWYSIDLLLPIIQLRKSHYDIELEGRTRDYFYVHQIMGYVLATVLIAWLSGLLG